MIEAKSLQGGVDMEKVRAFDREMQEIYKREYMDSEMVAIMFAVLGNLIAIVPFSGSDKLDWVVFWATLYLLGISIMFYLRPYLVIEGESIYKKIQYMPVSKKEICDTRIGYLNHRWKILFVIGLVLHQVFPLCDGSFGIRSILEIVFTYLLIWIWGFLQIYFVK